VPPRPQRRHPPDPGRAKNAYVREDRILAHLPVTYLMLTGAEPGTRRRRRTRRAADVRSAISPEEAIGFLREYQITLTWHAAAGTLQVGTTKAIKNVTGKAS
jgi:site-specific DNA recombinase